MVAIIILIISLLIGGVSVALIIGSLSSKSKGLNVEEFKKHSNDLENLDKEIKKLESQGIHGFTNDFIWDNFKKSPLTIFGAILPFITTTTIFMQELPIVNAIYGILLSLGLIGISFWWYRIYNIDTYAKIGSEKFSNFLSMYKKEYIEIEFKKLKAGFNSLNKKTKETITVNKLLEEFNQKHLDLIDIINNQQIINDNDKITMFKNVDGTFKEGVSLFKEIFDILLVEDKIDFSKASEAMILRHNQNKEDLNDLYVVLNNLIESFSLASLDIPKATSAKKSLDVANEAISILQDSMEKAKSVQENVRSMSYKYSENDYSEFSQKYKKE